MKRTGTKIATQRVLVTLTKEQIKVIDSKIGIYGSNRSDVLSHIITNWIIEQLKGRKNEKV